VQAIDKPLIVALLRPLWHEKRTTAQRLRNQIERVLDWAVTMDLRPEGNNPAAAKTIETLLGGTRRANGQPEAHHAALDYRELPAFMAKLRARQGNDARAFELMVLTATRSQETLGALHNEFEFGDEPVWLIPADRMKGRKEHRVPLAPEAVALARSMVPEPGNPFVFVGARAGRGLSGSVLIKLLRRKLGVAEVTVHGFRSAFSTWAAERARADRNVVEMCLAHTIPSAVERAYQRGDLLDRRRRLMEEWAKYCLSSPVAESTKVHAIGAVRR
jgi:integrase